MDQASHVAPRARLLGAVVDLVTCTDLLAAIERFVGAGRKAAIGNQNLHSLYLSRRSPGMAAFYARADLIEIDSMPLVLWGKLMGLGAMRANRCTYLDWRERFWALASARGWRVFCLGARAGVADEAARRLMAAWPGVEIATHHGFFDATAGSPENQRVLSRINAFRPHVVLIGMGMPRQEIWVGRNLDALQTGVALTVGAAFDYEVGLQPIAPRLYGQLSLEWLYRLAHDPRRLFRRYLIEPWTLVAPALADLRLYRFGTSPGGPARHLLEHPPESLNPAPSAQDLTWATPGADRHRDEAVRGQWQPSH